MTDIVFTECGPTVDSNDIIELEAAIGTALPAEFKDHYVRYNGGIPGRTCWIQPQFDAEYEVAQFKALAANSDSTSGSILFTYNRMIERAVIPRQLMPFGNDWGGNFFCLDLETGQVVFFATDSFDDQMSPEENHRHAKQVLCQSFPEFLHGLVHEDEVD